MGWSYCDQRLQWPVIVITGAGELSAAIETLKEGTRSLIEKPFNDEDFLSEVRSAFLDDAGLCDQNNMEIVRIA